MSANPVFKWTFLFGVLWLSWLGEVSVNANQPLPEPDQSPRNWSFKVLAQVPVQNGGRVKPLDSYARESVLFISGSRSLRGWKPMEMIVSWVTFPGYWQNQPFIRVTRDDVKRQLGLDEKRSSFSPQELLHNSVLIQYAERIRKGNSGAEPPGAAKSSPREQELRAVMDRLGLFHHFVSGQGWVLIPRPTPEAWASVLDTDPPGRDGTVIRNEFGDLVHAYHEGSQEKFQQASSQLKATVEGEIQGYEGTLKSKIQAEVLYNQIRPFLIAWIFYLIAALIWVFLEIGMVSKSHTKMVSAAGASAMGFAFVSHLFGFGLRCFVAGRPPVTNMYESVIWVSFGVVVFAGILYFVNRNRIVLAVASFLALLGLVAGDSAPAILDPSLNPLVPVLRSNYWLTIHVLTITLGYAAFALSFGLANISLFHFLKKPTLTKIASLNQLTYRSMQFGVVLIAAGTILGGIWADYSWGRFWGWDPKEVWALITLLCYLVILHGRYTDWVGQFGFAVWSSLSFLSVIMAWYGVNFILGVGLHSYGFSTGGTPWVLGFVGAELLYVGLVSAKHLGWKAAKKAR